MANGIMSIMIRTGSETVRETRREKRPTVNRLMAFQGISHSCRRYRMKARISNPKIPHKNIELSRS